MQNGYVERFNRIYRESILDAYLFFELDQVRQLTEEWMEEYNERRPHEALNNLTPKEWKANFMLLQTTNRTKKILFQAPGFIGTKKQKTLINSCLYLGTLT